MARLCIIVCLSMVLVHLCLTHPPCQLSSRMKTFDVEIKGTIIEGPADEEKEEEEDKYRNCVEVQKANFTADDVYTIYPDGRNAVSAYCDLTTEGGGWTVFQRRQDGSVSFYERFQSYEDGFGNPKTEYWLGLKHIRALVVQGDQRLRVDLADWEGNTAYAEYAHYTVNSAGYDYELGISGYSGNAGDALSYHNGMAFTTKDRDLDPHSTANCAVHLKGAWWYRTCAHSNLNGPYIVGGNHTSNVCMRWDTLKNSALFSPKKSQMKMRPVVFT